MGWVCTVVPVGLLPVTPRFLRCKPSPRNTAGSSRVDGLFKGELTIPMYYRILKGGAANVRVRKRKQGLALQAGGETEQQTGPLESSDVRYF